MRFGKQKMFLLLNGAVLFILVCYFIFWMIAGKTTTGRIVMPYQPSKITIEYQVGEKIYTQSYMRNGIPLSKNNVSIRYLPFAPYSSCINSFMGYLAEPLAWWLVFLLASAMLLLTNNTVFSKGTIFHLHKKFPWLSMDEYFPAEGEGPATNYASGKRAKHTERKKLLGMNKKEESQGLS